MRSWLTHVAVAGWLGAGCTQSDLQKLSETCPRSRWCDGDLLRTCVELSDSSGDFHRVYGEEDCSAVGPELGVVMTCGELQSTNGGSFVSCVDDPAIPCDIVGTISCTPGTVRARRACIDSADGPVWNSSGVCDEGDACRNSEGGGLFCYPVDSASCPAPTMPSCSNPNTLVWCAGNAADGYVSRSRACPTACTIDQSGFATCN